MALLIAEITYVSKHRAALIIAEKKGALNASYIAALIDADLADQQLADVNGWWATGAARLARGSFIMLRATPVFNCPSPVAEDSECFRTTSSGNWKMPLPTLPISVQLSRPVLKRIYPFIPSFFLHFPLNTLNRKATNLLSQPHPQVKTTANRNGRQRNECSPLL